MSLITAISRVKSIYDIGIKIRNHIYTRRNFKLLMKKHSVMLVQLEVANEIITDMAESNPEAMAYCREYAIPTKRSEV